MVCEIVPSNRKIVADISVMPAEAPVAVIEITSPAASGEVIRLTPEFLYSPSRLGSFRSTHPGLGLVTVACALGRMTPHPKTTSAEANPNIRVLILGTLTSYTSLHNAGVGVSPPATTRLR